MSETVVITDSARKRILADVMLSMLGGFVCLLVVFLRTQRGVVIFNEWTGTLLGWSMGAYLGSVTAYRARAWRPFLAGFIGGALCGLGFSELMLARRPGPTYITVAHEVIAGLSEDFIGFVIFSLLFLSIGVLAGFSRLGSQNAIQVIVRGLLAAIMSLATLVLGTKVLELTRSRPGDALQVLMAGFVFTVGFLPLVMRTRHFSGIASKGES